MNVYLQKFNKQFPNDLVFTAFMACNHRFSNDVIHYFEDINDVPITRDVYGYPPLVIGFIEDTIKYMEHWGVPIPAPLNIPDELNRESFLGRKFEIKTLAEFKKETRIPIFVKPHSKVKAFYSGIIREASSRKIFFEKDELKEPLDPNMLVLTSDVVDMLSEYRCFVKEGKLMDIRHYQGDCTVFPDPERILDMIAAYKSAPKAYSLDVAVINKPNYASPTSRILETFGKKVETYQSTVLVECQDMWSIGPYGLDPVIYLTMLKRRWIELFNSKPKI